VQISTFCMVCTLNLHVPAKFRGDKLNGCGSIPNVRFPIWRPSAILNFSNMRIFIFRTVCNDNLHVVAKFCPGRLHRCRVIKMLIFLIWRPSAILDMFYANAKPPAMCSSWSVSLLISEIWLEIVYSRFFWSGFWGFDP